MHSFGKSVPQVFEKNWMGTSEHEAVSLRLNNPGSSDSSIEQVLSQSGLHSMATGAAGGSIRAYYIGERKDKPGVFMGELNINLAARTVNATLKSSDVSALGAFKKHFLRAMSGL
eukprot:TRINITY_DN2837_c0_g1_i8.p2 TRINITY_DN2837_c0_g1~~TRINITY_DN2837_c0_g1_i8.p2  ORF type:complete len:115 (+),score=39.17 TRINITY_DN2837_c0_g1_i8:296-640(+)